MLCSKVVLIFFGRVAGVCNTFQVEPLPTHGALIHPRLRATACLTAALCIGGLPQMCKHPAQERQRQRFGESGPTDLRIWQVLPRFANSEGAVLNLPINLFVHTHIVWVVIPGRENNNKQNCKLNISK